MRPDEPQLPSAIVQKVTHHVGGGASTPSASPEGVEDVGDDDAAVPVGPGPLHDSDVDHHGRGVVGPVAAS